MVNILYEIELGENKDDIKFIQVKTFQKIMKQKAEVDGVKHLLVQQNIFFLKGSIILYDGLDLQDYKKLDNEHLVFCKEIREKKIPHTGDKASLDRCG